MGITRVGINPNLPHAEFRAMAGMSLAANVDANRWSSGQTDRGGLAGDASIEVSVTVVQAMGLSLARLGLVFCRCGR